MYDFTLYRQFSNRRIHCALLLPYQFQCSFKPIPFTPMTAAHIRENILEQSDETLLSSLPTTPRLACQCCGSVSVAKRTHSEITQTYYCPICKGDKPVIKVTYFIKNKTADPIAAVARHRAFWQRIYYEQLNRESGPKTFLIN